MPAYWKQRSKIKVLIVDDEKLMRNLIAGVIREIGIVDISFAANGIAALEYTGNKLSPFDLIICDWEMPEMDGMEFLKQLQGIKYKTYFLMLTGKKTEANVLDALKGGVDAYIAKPFTPLQLRDRIKALIGEKF
ncbi:MAG: response regulator [Rhodospirillales bacterium]|nr:response regulator [Rhodospirillales bacterium]